MKYSHLSEILGGYAENTPKFPHNRMNGIQDKTDKLSFLPSAQNLRQRRNLKNLRQNGNDRNFLNLSGEFDRLKVEKFKKKFRSFKKISFLNFYRDTLLVGQ